MKTQSTSIPRASYCLLLCLLSVAQGAEIQKIYNTTALNAGGAWNGGVVPGPSDVMLWDSLYTIPAADNGLGLGLLSQIGGNLSVQGIKVSNVGGTRNLVAQFVGFRDTVAPASSRVLTIGSGGIDMSAATQVMMIQSRVTLGANQNWIIADANTQASPATFGNNEDLALFSQAAATPFDFGGFTATVTGNGFITATSGWTFSNGTLDVGNNLTVIQGGSSRVTSLASNFNLVVSAGRLRLQSNSGAGGVSLSSAANVTVNGGIFELRTNTDALSLTQSGPVTLNTGSGLSQLIGSTGTHLISGNINVAGNTTWRVTRISGTTTPANAGTVSGNLSGAGNIDYLNTATLANDYCRLTGDNSGYSGTLSMTAIAGNRILRLASATAGSAAATWNIAAGNTLQVDGTNVQLGNLQGSGIITNPNLTTASTLTIGQGAFSGTINNGAALDATVGVTKVGSGTLQLSGANTYSGLSTVSAGTLVLTPDHSGAGGVSVADGAAFGVLQKAPDTTLVTGAMTVGATTGGTLQVDFGSQINPSAATLATGNLLFNGPSTVKIIGKNLTTGTFPLLQYASYDAGSTPVSGLTLDLPTRTTGSLADNPGIGINLTISTTEQVKWNGNVNGDWDIDPDGSNTIGTPNWLTTVGNAAARYIQGSEGTDVVTFNDDAAGTTTVNLTTTLSPLGLTIDNTAKNYTFTGAGKLSGTVGLEKKGTGSLTLANTTPNDYQGGTLVTAGTLILGDGTTAGAGVVAPVISNEGTVVLNRPDNHNYNYLISGNGTLEKAQANTLTFPAATTLAHPFTLTAGIARFAAGGFLNGVLAGSGTLEATGGTLEIGGLDPNTHTGPVNVSAGQLRLNKSADTQAVGGDITLTGGATLNIVTNEQIADTATIHVLGTSTDSLLGSTGTETFANAVLNGSAATTQMILRNFSVVTGTATVDQGILGVASSHSATINAIVMNTPTSMVRVAGSGGPSTLSVGSGGITAGAGEIQVKFNTNNQNGVLKLAGDVTTTGNLAFTNAGYTGVNLNVVELSGSRSFNIGDATTTTVAPDLGDYDNTPDPATPGTLVKNGTGTLVLSPLCNAAHTGGTTVNAGTLQVNGPHVSTLQVNGAGTLAGTGTLAAATVVDGTVSPGVTVGQLNSTSTVTLGPDSDYAFEVGSWTGLVPGTDWDHLSVDTLALTATPSNKLTIRVLGTPAGFTEVAKTMVIATSVQPITGFDAAAIQIDATGFSGAGTWVVQSTVNTIELVYTAAPGSAYDDWATDNSLDETNNGKAQDPDGDGQTNLAEFALDDEPLSGAASGKVVGKIAAVGADQALTLTLPVRDGAVFAGATEQTSTVDGVVYRIQGGNDLGAWTLAVSEVTGGDATAIQTGLPALSTGWTYRTFRTPGPVSGDPKEFIRVLIEAAP